MYSYVIFLTDLCGRQGEQSNCASDLNQLKSLKFKIDERKG